MSEIFIAGEKDFREVTDFINMVFKKNFPDFMEKVYTEENFMQAEHYCIRDEGKIAACVGVYPQIIQCGEDSAECAWIGSVSVDPGKRGRGFMRELMTHVDGVLADRKIPFVYLSGRRNRYGFYGYEITGVRNYFSFEEENIRLTIGFDACNGYDFQPLYHRNTEELNNVMQLYKKRLVTVRNEKNMVDAMRTWGYKPYVIKKEGEFRGYFLIKENEIAEIELVNSDEILQVCGAVMLCFGREDIRIEARKWEREKCRIMAGCCERYSIETLGNMKIFDYAGTLLFFMKLERKVRRLMPGRLTIHVSMGETFYIEISENSVETGTADHEEADLFLTSSQLIRLMFTQGNEFIAGYDHELVKNWFPLSYTPERVDEF
ncbi:MAG: GNAT family N-acetyltransferase [Lachnospiraceae bacterium]